MGTTPAANLYRIANIPRRDGPRGDRTRFLVPPPRLCGEPDGGGLRWRHPHRFRPINAGWASDPRGRQDMAGPRRWHRIRPPPRHRPHDYRLRGLATPFIWTLAPRCPRSDSPPHRGAPWRYVRRVRQTTPRPRTWREGPGLGPIRFPPRDLPSLPSLRTRLVARAVLERRCNLRYRVHHLDYTRAASRREHDRVSLGEEA